MFRTLCAARASALLTASSMLVGDDPTSSIFL
jgi:hypothetical protein